MANYGAVGYSNVYNGIDLRYYGNQRQLEYDFAPSNAGANVNDAPLAMQFSGAKSVSIGANGDLVLTLDDSGKTIQLSSTGHLPGHRCGPPGGHQQLRHS